MKRTSTPANIFLIHAHADREAVHKLYQRLVHEGLNAWLDAERLQPGQDWRHEIRNALLACDVVLVCLSRAFDEKQGYRHEELKLAIEKARFLPAAAISIIPVRLEECDMPESLRHLHRVDLFTKGGYQKLARALRG
jgi:hypothetical protein